MTSDTSAIPSGVRIIHRATNSLMWTTVYICPRSTRLKRLRQNHLDGQLKEDDFMPRYTFSDVLRLYMVAGKNKGGDNIIETSSDTRRL